MCSVGMGTICLPFCIYITTFRKLATSTIDCSFYDKEGTAETSSSSSTRDCKSAIRQWTVHMLPTSPRTPRRKSSTTTRWRGRNRQKYFLLPSSRLQLSSNSGQGNGKRGERLVIVGNARILPTQLPSLKKVRGLRARMTGHMKTTTGMIPRKGMISDQPLMQKQIRRFSIWFKARQPRRMVGSWTRW